MAPTQHKLRLKRPQIGTYKSPGDSHAVLELHKNVISMQISAIGPEINLWIPFEIIESLMVSKALLPTRSKFVLKASGENGLIFLNGTGSEASLHKFEQNFAIAKSNYSDSIVFLEKPLNIFFIRIRNRFNYPYAVVCVGLFLFIDWLNQIFWSLYIIPLTLLMLFSTVAIPAFNRYRGPFPYLLSGYYFLMGKYEQAEKWLIPFCNLHPAHFGAHVLLVKVYTSQNRFFEAREWCALISDESLQQDLLEMIENWETLFKRLETSES